MTEPSPLGYKLFVFWYQNDWGAFYRRNEALTLEFAKHSKIKEIVHIEPAVTPLELARRLWQALFGKNAGLRRVAWLHIKKSLRPVPVRSLNNLFLFNTVSLFPDRIEEILPLARSVNIRLISWQMSIVWKRFSREKNLTNIVLFYPPQRNTGYFMNQFEKLGARIFVDLVDDALHRSKHLGVSDFKFKQHQESYTIALRKCEGAFAVGEDTAKGYGEHFNVPIEHIPNGVNPDAAPEQGKQRDCKSEGKKTICYLGAINRELDEKIGEEILSRLPDVKLVIVGPIVDKSGRKWRALKAKYANLNLVGPVVHHDVKYFMDEADVLVFFKKPEYCQGGDSLKLYQYLTTGKPIVTTRVPPADKFNHVLYIADDPETFVRQLEIAFQEDDPAIAVSRRESVKGHSWTQIAERVIKKLTSD